MVKICVAMGILDSRHVTGAGPSKPVAQKVVTEAPHMHLPSILPPQVAEQIRSAQQKAALSGEAPPLHPVGSYLDRHSNAHL